MNQRSGLPDHLFQYISSITPLINVDVLLVDPCMRFLLTWRDDGIYGPGWHVPGGIIRFKESISDRILKVCISEAGSDSYQSLRLVQINQIMNPQRDYRGHFISLIFTAHLSAESLDSIPSAAPGAELTNGARKWFCDPPHNIIAQHRRYLPIMSDIGGFSVPLWGNLMDEYSEFHETSF